MRKGILILSNCLDGLYSFRKEVIQAIADQGYDVHISIPDADSKLIPFFNEMGCHIIPTLFNRRGMNPISDLKLIYKYWHIIRILRPTAVLSYTIKPNIYGGIACRITGTPQIANITGLGDAVENGGWLQKLTVLLYKIGLGKAQRIFFQNSTNRVFCENHSIGKGRTALLPGSGVNLIHHSFQSYPADNGIVRFLYIGRLLKDKGIDEFFDAARVVKKQYPNVEFQILGTDEGNYAQELDNLVKVGVLKFLGETLDVRPYIGAAECTIMPSYHEGMSNVNLESAANGRPVITTNVPGCMETVDDGKTGFVAVPRSSQSLIDCIEKFINLPYCEKLKMGLAGRKKMERFFDRQIVVNAYLNEINSIK